MKNCFKIMILILASILNVKCQMKKQEKLDLTTATIKVDSCGITIKGKKLEVGVPIDDWIKVLGKPSRVVGHFVWDDLGIGVSNDNNSEKIVDALFIYFLNLDSPEGQAGLLNFGSEYESAENVPKKANGFIITAIDCILVNQTNLKP